MTREELIEELAYYGDIELAIKCPYTMDNCYNTTNDGVCCCNKCIIEKEYTEFMERERK